MKWGFTLVEVMIATLILSLSLVVLLTGASNCLAIMKAGRQFQDAEWTLGMGEVDYPMFATNNVKQLEVDAEHYDNGCTYSRTVEDDEDKDGLYVVRITVTWPDRGKDMREEVVRYIFEKKD